MSDITLASARERYHAARAAYASVSHLLTLDQRRSFRTRMSQATLALRQAENAHWQKLFAADEELIIGLASHYYKSPVHIRATAEIITAAVSEKIRLI